MCNSDETKKDEVIECSRKGDIDGLYWAIQEHPQVLQDIQDIPFVDTPLHEAAAHGQTAMAIEILNLMPSFGTKLNPEGLAPLHVAIEKGYEETAVALAEIDKQLVLVKGRGGQTPLHYAATVPRVYREDHYSLDRLLVGLLVACPQAVGVLNNKLQTVIHVAAENGRFKAVRILKKWLATRQTESLLTVKDIDGNTALHIAAQHHCPEDLLKAMMKVVVINKANKNQQTPVDVASSDEVRQVLEDAGCLKGRDLKKRLSVYDYLREKDSGTLPEYLMGSYYLLTKELTMEMRNTILVIAALIATATYQGVLQPPGGVYSAEGNSTAAAMGRLLESQVGTPPSGRMVMMGDNYNYFMPTNTLAFILSNVIIMFVLPARYFIVIVHFTLIFMCVSYLLALSFISESNTVSDIMVWLSAAAIYAAFLLKMWYYIVRALYGGDVWWLRRIGVMATNCSERYSVGRTIDEDKEKMLLVPFITRMKLHYKILMKN